MNELSSKAEKFQGQTYTRSAKKSKKPPVGIARLAAKAFGFLSQFWCLGLQGGRGLEFRV